MTVNRLTHYFGNLMIGSQPPPFFGMYDFHENFEQIEDALNVTFNQIFLNHGRTYSNLRLIEAELLKWEKYPWILSEDKDEIEDLLSSFQEKFFSIIDALGENGYSWN